MTSRSRRSLRLQDPFEVKARMVRNEIPVSAEDLATFEVWVESQIPVGASEREAKLQRLLLEGHRPRPMAVSGIGERRDEIAALMIEHRDKWSPPKEDQSFEGFASCLTWSDLPRV